MATSYKANVAPQSKVSNITPSSSTTGSKNKTMSSGSIGASAPGVVGSTSGSSTKSSGVVPGSGATQYVSTNTASQDAIKAQMTANSIAWHNASTQAEKDALHAQNVSLAAQLGSGVSFDSSNGVWHGLADGYSTKSAVPATQQQGVQYNYNQIPTVDAAAYQQQITDTYTQLMNSLNSYASQYKPTDYSDYLRKLAAENLASQKEALSSSYQTNLSNLQAQQDALAKQYQSARNDTSATSAQAQQRFNETAAAYGLNSGTAGQAALSIANERQRSLSQIQQSETAANQEVERQRVLLGQQYQSAMNQAIANNNYQLYQQLYKEATRVEQALQQQQQYNTQQALQAYQLALNQANSNLNYNSGAISANNQNALSALQLQIQQTQQQWENDYKQQQLQWQQTQTEYENQWKQQQATLQNQIDSAKLVANGGDFTQYGKIYGWDQATVDRLNNLWQQNQTLAVMEAEAKIANYWAKTGATTAKTAGTSSKSSGYSGNVNQTVPTGSAMNNFGEAAMTWAAKYSADPVTFAKQYYSQYGFKTPTAALNALNAYLAENKGSSATSDFTRLIQTVGAKLAQGDASGAANTVDSLWDKLSASQRGQVQAVFSQYGVKYNR